MFLKTIRFDKTRATGAWGDDLIELPLSDLWYPASWDSVSDDELAFLLPSLSQWRPRHCEISLADGPVGYLRRTLSVRATRNLAFFADAANALSAADVLNLLIEERFITQLERADFDTLPVTHVTLGDDLDRSVAGELHALAHIDRILFDALGAPGGETSRTPIVARPSTLTHAAVISVHARFNAAYVYPEYTLAHELFTVAAIVGHLLDGRSAHISPRVAGAIVDVFEQRKFLNEDDPARVLQDFASRVGGVGHLVRAAARGMHRTVVIKPKRPPFPASLRGKPFSLETLRRVRGAL